MERIKYVEDGVVYECDEYGNHNFICFDEFFDAGPRLAQKRVIIKSSDVRNVCAVFVQTNDNLCEHVGYIVIRNNERPKKLYLKDNSEPILIEDGSPIYEALSKMLKKPLTLAEEICKAPDNSEESYR